MSEKWMVAAKKADFNQIAKDFSIDPVIARLIRNRDVTGNDEIRRYLYGDLKDLYPPETMKDLRKAAELMLFKIRSGARIRIIGDYDIDGITASYILKTGLARLGGRIDVRIPDRIRDGYGLGNRLVKEAIEDGVDTILTCDNGIASAEAICMAKEAGLCVVVTDHHEVPYTEDEEGRRNFIIPQADAVVDPKQEDCSYPFKGLCGAAVAFKLICCMYDLCESLEIPASEKEALLPFAAIATIGDVMDLKDENRILVKEGLRRIADTKNIGIRELVRQNNLDIRTLSVYHIGFVIGPCLNASGRLDHASRALDLLCADNVKDAARLAGDLIALNESRKRMTEIGFHEAVEMVEESSLKKDKVLVVYLPEIHESLAGIIAGRLRERYQKPVFVLTRTEKGVKGSGRSIESYSMYDELVKCRDLLTKFGGHPMAAGLSMEEKNVAVFRKQMNEKCTLTEEELRKVIHIDVPMPIGYVTHKLVDQIDLLQPFGKGNEKPVFAEKNIKISGMRVLGKNRNVVKMRVTNANGYTLDGVYFGDGDAFADFVNRHDQVSVTYFPSIDHYMNRETLQITIGSYC